MRNDGASTPATLPTTETIASLTIEPIGSPAASKPRRNAPRHAHQCSACESIYECRGADETGYCAPVCAPCYWVALGSQLSIYQEMVTELERKRSSIEHRIGKDACRAAEARRRDTYGRGLVVAFGNVFDSSQSDDVQRSIGNQFSGRGGSFCAEQAQGAASNGK
jgi:hypothetical protein